MRRAPAATAMTRPPAEPGQHREHEPGPPSHAQPGTGEQRHHCHGSIYASHGPVRKDEATPDRGGVSLIPGSSHGCDAACMSGTDRARELGAFLAGIPFFASFDEGTLVWLARQFEPVHAQAGDAIIAEGDPGDGLYVLLSGRARG